MREFIVEKSDEVAERIKKYGGDCYTGELIRCKKCAEHGKRTNYCAIWKCNTSPNGYCHRGRK